MSTNIVYKKPAHALLSPSAAHRWLNCPGSILKCKDIPSTTNDAAKEGNRLHDLAEKILKEYAKSGELPKEIEPKIKTYVDYVVKLYEETLLFKGEATLHIEVALKQYVNEPYSEFECFGTADCIIEMPEGLIVIDYKSGYGEVSVEDNEQLDIYSWLAKLKFKKRVALQVIVQRDMVKEKFIPHQLIDLTSIGAVNVEIRYLQRELKEGAKLLKAGEWCQYCPAKFDCEAYAESVSPVVKELPAPQKVTDEELAKLLDISNFLSGYIKAVKDEVSHRMIDKGSFLPGYKVVQANGKRKWENEKEALEMLKKKGYKVNQITDKVLKSFTKIEKLDKKAKELVATLTAKTAGNYKVVANNEKGEAIQIGGDKLPALEHKTD